MTENLFDEAVSLAQCGDSVEVESEIDTCGTAPHRFLISVYYDGGIHLKVTPEAELVEKYLAVKKFANAEGISLEEAYLTM